MNRMREFTRLSWSDWVLLLAAGVLVLVARIGLTVFGHELTRVIVRRLSSVVRRVTKLDAERIPWGVDTAANLVPGEVTCLPRSLVCHALLESVGCTAHVRFGVMREDDGLKAHAWVERHGDVVIGEMPDLGRYRRLAESV